MYWGDDTDSTDFPLSIGRSDMRCESQSGSITASGISLTYKHDWHGEVDIVVEVMPQGPKSIHWEGRKRLSKLEGCNRFRGVWRKERRRRRTSGP
jgi:hypothetical protein